MKLLVMAQCFLHLSNKVTEELAHCMVSTNAVQYAIQSVDMLYQGILEVNTQVQVHCAYG